MKVFIVRPFGKKSVNLKDRQTHKISSVVFDFNEVENKLIKPAIEELNLTGGTTGEIFEAGDIREDMFSELLLADIVIADISIYNANVFYELGIRHALRDKMTILIKCKDLDETPFDINGYRYIIYDMAQPENSLDELKKSIEQTANADRIDSPVFNVLPKLKSQDPEKFLAIPIDFIESVGINENTQDIGMLNLLAYEAESFAWKFPAFRLIGEALFSMRALDAAKMVWEKITNSKPLDTQANEKLATIYQRLAELEMVTNPSLAISLLTKSDFTIDIFINTEKLTSFEKAEAYALHGRNAKTRWINSWAKKDSVNRQIVALESANLDKAIKFYEKGFNEDLNHYYSGINALGLLITKISLAEFNPVVWESSFNSKLEAEIGLKELKNKLSVLSVAVQFSIESSKIKMDASGQDNNWLNITEADFYCLTSTNPLRVALLYKKVLEGTSALNRDSVRRQLKIYEELGIIRDNVTAALSAITIGNNIESSRDFFILFTGHMIDQPDRKEPRFPAAKEENVRRAIAEAVNKIKNNSDENVSLKGIAGGACGGDIIFHEVCEALGIYTEMYLAMPRDQFISESVSFAGNNWVERFDKLYKKLQHPVLSEDKKLPKWLETKQDYNIWVRNNLWELNSALANGGINMTLIALWDGKGGDGFGGTEHMVGLAKKNGAKIVVLDINQL